MISVRQNKNGFTLLELLISLAVASVVMMGIYSLYDTHQKTYMTQSQIVEMHQNLRAGMLLMVNEIREAGYDIFPVTRGRDLVRIVAGKAQELYA